MKRIFALIVAVAMIATLCVFTSADEVTDGLVAHYALSSDLTDSVGDADGSVVYKLVTDTETEGSSEVTYSDGALVIADGSDVGVKFPVSGITSDFTVSVTLTVLAESRAWASPFIWIGGTDQSTENWIGLWTGFYSDSWVAIGSNDSEGHRLGVNGTVSSFPATEATYTIVVESNVAYLYINGVYVGQSNGTNGFTETWGTEYDDITTSTMPNPWSADDCAIYIAANAWGDANSYASYSDLYVYNRALTSTEVATLCGVEASDDTTAEDDTTAADEPTSAYDAITGTKVTVKSVIDDGNGSWGGSADTTADHAFDGDTSTFYDGAGEEAWVGCEIDSTVITAVALYPRSDATYYSRLEGAVIQGSNDMENWTDLCTVGSVTLDEWTVCEITDTTAYTYVRVYNCAYGNVAEMEIYTAGTTNSTAVSPQTGFAFVGLGVVAVASGAAIVVSKKRH